MLTIEHNGYYPLTEENLDRFVPRQPGIYTLAVQLANGVHHNFFTSQSDNLYRSLRTVSLKDPCLVPSIVLDYMSHYRCYFTYFVILKPDYRNEMEKILTQTSDPVSALKIINCN